ncbi:hypothetical protein SAMN05421542_2794 [Chryseobacterium jejuense]|uniref:Uncharacterized protein n=1 Tax=Chryseobacterium jejuense TaxID=445960 RepID=A0A2X2VHL3_CHRJE|nr:hypothetical protein SAMN05421542_2794 [Chryseobacterium jejuense]SQB28028.1 Uncharacterised protein [Chryseobacterium jejuense]
MLVEQNKRGVRSIKYKAGFILRPVFYLFQGSNFYNDINTCSKKSAQFAKSARDLLKTLIFMSFFDAKI